MVEVDVVVHGEAPPCPIGRSHAPMILQILADSGQIADDRNAVAGQQRARPNPRKLQQLRRPDGAGGNHDLAARPHRHGLAVLAVGHARGASVDHFDALDQSAGLDAAIGTTTRRREIGVAGRDAAAVADRGVIQARAFLAATVEVGDGRQTDLGTSGQERLADLVAVLVPGDLHRAVAAMEVRCAAGIGFEPLEIRQAIVERPALVAHLAPMVVIRGQAPDIHHAIDGARSADDLAPRPVDPATAQFGLRLGGKFPVHLGVEEGLGEAQRDGQPAIVLVVRSGLQQQDAMAPRRSQAIDDRRPRGSSPDDDKIELTHSIACLTTSYAQASYQEYPWEGR